MLKDSVGVFDIWIYFSESDILDFLGIEVFTVCRSWIL